MTNNTIDLPFLDKINSAVGIVLAILTYFFGEHWFLFAAFLLLNIVDYITGCLKSRINGVTNSKKGMTGLLKKVGYWLMILLSFLMSLVFIDIGEAIGVDLTITNLLGWFVLSSLIINEIRSIIENFIEAGYKVPKILSKGLSVVNTVLESKMDIDNDDTSD